MAFRQEWAFFFCILAGCGSQWDHNGVETEEGVFGAGRKGSSSQWGHNEVTMGLRQGGVLLVAGRQA